MSCSEHNTTDCLICVSQTYTKCKHGYDRYCGICGPVILGARPAAADLGRETLELARNRIYTLTAQLDAITRRASELTDELGAMRSDRDQVLRQLAQMREAFERQSRQLAKLQKPGVPRR